MKANVILVKRMLKQYISVVHEGNLFQCETCGKSFTTEKVMNDHVLAQHENIKAFQCESCGKYYGSKLILRDHRKTVHGTKKHICDSCGYVTTQQNFLNKHINTVHKGIKPHQCHHRPFLNLMD